MTGAAGFIGSMLCERLLKDGHEVLGVDSFVEYYPRWLKLQNLEPSKSYSNFEFREGDLTKLDLRALLQNVEVIFHQAAQAGVRASWGSYFSSYVQNNIEATQLLLESALGLDHIKKIVYASSSSVYGDAESYPTKETNIPKPVSPYGVTKLAAEHLVSLYGSQYGLPTVSLRYFTVFGPRQRPDMAFHRFIAAALKGEEIVVYGDGEQSRDFTFIDDIVEANLLALQASERGSVLNVGGGPHATVNQVLGLLEGMLGKLKVARREKQRGDARHTAADVTLARKVLGFEPKVSLEQGLRAEIEWLRGILR